MVANYLTLLQARQYAPSTLGAIAGTLKSFCLLLPQPRRDRIIDNFALVTSEDIDAYLQAAADQGLAPATINIALVKLRCFFTFLLEDGYLHRQPVRRHRHQVLVPQTLPRPMAQQDVVAFFQVIDSLRDRLIFLLMLR
jgi:site-specific recombinase XerD